MAADQWKEMPAKIELMASVLGLCVPLCVHLLNYSSYCLGSCIIGFPHKTMSSLKAGFYITHLCFPKTAPDLVCSRQVINVLNR